MRRRSYFSQFGKILRLRLSRSKRTGASKHFAFLEFEDAAVAEVVQKTMVRCLFGVAGRGRMDFLGN